MTNYNPIDIYKPYNDERDLAIKNPDVKYRANVNVLIISCREVEK